MKILVVIGLVFFGAGVAFSVRTHPESFARSLLTADQCGARDTCNGFPYIVGDFYCVNLGESDPGTL
ncbi:hypothetical protein WJX77_007144 [Trebouxia sp. C0004]